MYQPFSEDLERIIKQRAIVPILNPKSLELSLQVAEVLVNLDFPLLEITCRNALGAPIIAGLKKRFPRLLIGAGTLRNAHQVKEAADAGADFGLSPAFNPVVVSAARHHRLPFIPGINSPSQLEQALETGFNLVKFFPAEASGGVAMLKALAGPYPEASYLPTGGIDDSNLADYLACRTVAAVGGTWFLELTTKEVVDIARIMAVFQRVAALRGQNAAET